MRLLNKFLVTYMTILSIAGCRGSGANHNMNDETNTAPVDSIVTVDTLIIKSDTISKDTIGADTAVANTEVCPQMENMEGYMENYKKTLTLYEVDFCPFSVKSALERFVKADWPAERKKISDTTWLYIDKEVIGMSLFKQNGIYYTDDDITDDVVGYIRIDGLLIIFSDYSEGNFKNYIVTNKNPITFTFKWRVYKGDLIIEDNYEGWIYANYRDLPPCNADSVENDSFPGFWSWLKKGYR